MKTDVLVTRAASDLLVAVVGDGDGSSDETDGDGDGLAVAAEDLEAVAEGAEEATLVVTLHLLLLVAAGNLVLAVVHVRALVVSLLEAGELNLRVDLGVGVLGVAGGLVRHGDGKGGEGQDDGLEGEHFDGWVWD